MSVRKHFSNIVLILFVLLALSGSYLISKQVEKPTVNVTKQQSSLNINENFWNYFHLGQKRLFSSIYWIATILESDHDHYKKSDLNSWMFLRFKTISFLEPKFYENYNFGSIYLSIIKNDLEGASFMYKKGLEIYPDDFNLLKNASFHFYFELQDYSTSHELLKRLKPHPKVTPQLLGSLARIESQNGNLGDAFNILEESYNSLKNKEDFLASIILSQLYSIKAEIDLKCLNSKQSNCNFYDLDNEKYLRTKDGFYYAKKAWTPYRIRNKNVIK